MIGNSDAVLGLERQVGFESQRKGCGSISNVSSTISEVPGVEEQGTFYE